MFDELKEAKSTRGKTELGDREEGTATKRKWSESGPKDEDTGVFDIPDKNQSAPSFFAVTEFSAKLEDD